MVGQVKKKLRRDMTSKEKYLESLGGLIGLCTLCETEIHQSTRFVVNGTDELMCLGCYEDKYLEGKRCQCN